MRKRCADIVRSTHAEGMHNAAWVYNGCTPIAVRECHVSRLNCHTRRNLRRLSVFRSLASYGESVRAMGLN